MTRTEKALRDGAAFLLEAGYAAESIRRTWSRAADRAEAKGRHDEAREIRAAVESIEGETE